jgi:hypothetical protein
MAGKNRWSTFVVNPPFMKCPVQLEIEALFWWESLGKSIRDISAKDKEVLTS